jgi:hypothetical protein
MTTEALVDLRNDLVGAIALRRRRAGRKRVLLAVAIALAVIGSLALVVPSDSTRALAITRTSDWIELRIEDATAGTDRMTAELRDAGVDAEVQLVVAPPSRVGTWIAVQGNGPWVALTGDKAVDDRRIQEQVAATRAREIQIEPKIARVPKGFRGHVILIAGRAPLTGEDVGSSDESGG